MSEPYGYVWTSVKDGMEIRFTRMYPNEFYKPTDITPVYKTPQRTWVGLTDEEIEELHGSPMNLEHSGALKWVRAIEAKLKEKNND